MADPFLKEKPPKTTGRERIGLNYIGRLLYKWRHLPPNDLIATATKFTVNSMVYNYKHYIYPFHKIDQ
jgi:anhydro-N-acetylmuramic acid kinase